MSRPLSGAVVTVMALLLSSCGGGDEGASDSTASPSPSTTVAVPEGVSLTEGGTEMEYGDKATVVFEPNQRRGSVLDLTVERARRGRIKDFSRFVLNASVKSSTPYYVDVRVKNVGESDVGGFAVPLFLVDASNTLRQASTFTTEFQKCESKPLPRRFGPGDTFDTCLAYLAPKPGTFEAISFRPTQAFDPITWTGAVSPPAEPKKPKKPKKPNKPDKSKKPRP